ncbi:MAG: tRNA epoxyqueuosine(34) reductase QueG [Gammaproteobacteria bacterium]|nr:tRNA epoxyqueuosine(34) reductase QueG [Gammaproteobacteria bacterium]
MNTFSPDATFVDRLREWAAELGFQQLGVARPDPGPAGERLREWLGRGLHADMTWLDTQAAHRLAPADLVPGTVRVISVRMDYWRDDAYPASRLAHEPDRAWISRYALGRDYHRVMRPRLQRLADRIVAAIGPFGYRVFVDSAPVLEKPLAQSAGLGWIGRHTNLISHTAGSWFFLGEMFTDLPLPPDTPARDGCGSCQACLKACPTGAIIAPYVLDAARCISYLTIENRGSIPEPLRAAIGNRVFGCDDCQLACPWNRFARPSMEADFAPRQGLDRPSLVELFGWSEPEWQHRLAGSAIRRVGYAGWLRNLAVALGNGPASPEAIQALTARSDDASALVREHVAWALGRLRAA